MRINFLSAFVLSAMALQLSACTETISTNPNPVATIFNALPDPIKAATTKDLETTAVNFDAANSIGLPNMDLFAACQHMINQDLGIEVAPNAVPYPKIKITVDGVASFGSEVIINALLLNQLTSQGITIPENCAAVFGIMNINAMGKGLGVIGGVPIKVGPSLTVQEINSKIATKAKPAPSP
jgi:hypothetical protein